MGSIHGMAMLMFKLLILSSLVSGSLLFPRQGTTSSSALSSQPSSPIPEDNDPNDPNRPTLATSTDASSNNIANPSSSSLLASSTSTANSTNTTNSTDLDPTITSNPTPLNNTNDPDACHKDFDADQGVFPGPLCHPGPGDLIPTNTTYSMTWDPALFPQDANITITLFPANFPTTGVKKIENAFYTTPDTQPALQGSAWIEVPTSLLNGSAELNATVVLFRQGSELGGPEDARQYVGPEVVLFDPAKGNGTSLASHSNNTSATSGSSGGSTKKLGEEVGIPIGLIFFLALLGVAIFFILRRRKATGGDYLARRKSSRAGSARGAGAGGLVGPHRRTESFHDEPTMGGGVELQSTTRSSRAYSGASSVSRLSEGDSWGWGSPGGGGVSTTVTGGGGNAFREELGRQQTGRGY